MLHAIIGCVGFFKGLHKPPADVCGLGDDSGDCFVNLRLNRQILGMEVEKWDAFHNVRMRCDGDISEADFRGKIIDPRQDEIGIEQPQRILPGHSCQHGCGAAPERLPRADVGGHVADEPRR